MLDLIIAALILSVPHVAVIYWGIYRAGLEYSQMMALNGAIAVLTAIIVRITVREWKPRLAAALKRDEESGDLFLDGVGMLAIFAGAALLTSIMMSHRFGLQGWLGVFGTNVLVNWLF